MFFIMFCFRHFKDGNIYKKKYKNSEISNTSSPGRKVSRGRTTGRAQIYRRCPLLLERYEVQPKSLRASLRGMGASLRDWARRV